MIKNLITGAEKKGAIAVLICLANITSERKIKALNDHYVKGHTLQLAALNYDVDVSNLAKSAALLEHYATKIYNYNVINGVTKIVTTTTTTKK